MVYSCGFEWKPQLLLRAFEKLSSECQKIDLQNGIWKKTSQSLLWIFNEQVYEYFKSGKYLKKIPKNAVLQYEAQTLVQLTWGRGLSFWWKNLKCNQLFPFAEFRHVYKIQNAVLISYLCLVAVAFKNRFCHDIFLHKVKKPLLLGDVQ